MKCLLVLLMATLSACSHEIAGLSRNERLFLYSAALVATGHTEVGAVVYGLRRPVTSAKQPQVPPVTP